MPTYYTTAQVVAAAEALDRFNPWIRDTFFPSVVTFETEEVLFDKLGRRKKIAPFVSPNIPGKEREQRSRSVRAYKPPYVKPKSGLNPSDAIARRAGEGYGGTMAVMDRYDQMVLQTLADHENEITGREELMCVDALKTGQVVAVGDGINDTISYGRDAELTDALTSTARWGESGVKPLASIRTWGRLIAAKSGAVARKVVLGYGAAELFLADSDVREILDNRRSGEANQMAMAGSATGGVEDVARLIGQIDGVEYWEYLQTYETDAGVSTHYWPEHGVGLVSPSVMNGHMTYGAILDIKSLRAEQRFAKQYEEDDPSREVILTQSAPLPVPVEPNASFFATVR
ncbi:major capsid protein [Hoeflea sp.]|uniref:major capsid protein n=1 Tax=Hoeflea sp. TaxID=1940281 RepID=UPI001991F0FB|nr:major capsid protein [Hoeflea sp.]MBC7280031.1 major capsid protein [Hoeflea sp.]